MLLRPATNVFSTVIAADGLYKRDVFRMFFPSVVAVAHTRLTANLGFPDPFAVATIAGEQTHTTSVIKKTLNPYWNEPFDLYVLPFYPGGTRVNHQRCHRKVNEDSILAIQIFDQKKFKKKDQGFLGVINVRIGDVIDLQMGGDGMYRDPKSVMTSPG